MYLVDICIYYHFKKDESPEAGRTVCFHLISLGFCFYFYFNKVVLKASKPMCKLYLVLAVLSSVTRFVHHFKRCNVTSTIKTQNDTSWRWLVWFCLILWCL